MQLLSKSDCKVKKYSSCCKYFKRSTKSSRFLSFAGLMLCIVGVVIYLATNSTAETSYDDRTKIVVAFILIFNALVYGYLREKSCRNPKQDPSTILVLVSSKLVWHGLLSAANRGYISIAIYGGPYKKYDLLTVPGSSSFLKAGSNPLLRSPKRAKAQPLTRCHV